MKDKRVWNTIGLVLIFWPVVGFFGLIIFWSILWAIKEADPFALIVTLALISMFVGIGIMAVGEGKINEN